MKDVVSYDKWMNEKELFIIEARKLGVDTTEVETPMGIQFKYGNTRDMFKIWLASANRDGYKLVPIEATDSQWVAGIDAYTQAMDGQDILSASAFFDIYKAMIGAAE